MSGNLGNSRFISSAQDGPHRDLDALVRRHLAHPFRKPILEYNRAAFAAALAARDQWRADALALTFVDGGVNDYSPGYGEALEGLRVIKHQYDPTGVFASGLPI